MVVARGVGYSQLRILPKMNCVRPIVNCANRNAVGVGRQPSVNDSLKNAFSALSFERVGPSDSQHLVGALMQLYAGSKSRFVWDQ